MYQYYQYLCLLCYFFLTGVPEVFLLLFLFLSKKLLLATLIWYMLVINILHFSFFGNVLVSLSFPSSEGSFTGKDLSTEYRSLCKQFFSTYIAAVLFFQRWKVLWPQWFLMKMCCHSNLFCRT